MRITIIIIVVIIAKVIPLRHQIIIVIILILPFSPIVISAMLPRLLFGEVSPAYSLLAVAFHRPP